MDDWKLKARTFIKLEKKPDMFVSHLSMLFSLWIIIGSDREGLGIGLGLGIIDRRSEAISFGACWIQIADLNLTPCFPYLCYYWCSQLFQSSSCVEAQFCCVYRVVLFIYLLIYLVWPHQFREAPVDVTRGTWGTVSPWRSPSVLYVSFSHALLNPLTLFWSTSSWDKLFDLVTTLSEKKYFWISSLVAQSAVMRQ